MKITRLIVGLMLFLVFATVPAFAQTNFDIKIYASDGSGWMDSVVIGKYTSATNGIGDSLSPVLNEAELPPLPVGGSEQAADLRLIDPTQIPPNGPYGQGVAVDLRHLVSDGQKDVYRLSFRRSSEGSAITLSWQAGLSAVGGGGFFITDGDFGGFYFDPVDMNEDTVLDLGAPFTNLAGGSVDIVAGDGSMMRSFTNPEIALSVDYKGKQKYEKRKPAAVDFAFDLVTPDNVEGYNLALQFSMYVDITLSFPGDMTGRLPITLMSNKKYTPSFVPPLDSGQVVHVEGRGVKGKPVKTKYFFGARKRATVESYIYQILRMRMPNINNVGDELYLQGANLGIGLTSQVGTTEKGKPIFRSISVPKWKDVMKTMYKKKKPLQYIQDGPAECLDTIKGKLNYKKPIKSLDPFKTIRYKTSVEHGNRLIGEMIALKFNIAASAYDKTASQGFGELIYTNDGHPFDGKTVNDIALSGDSALSCWGGLPAGWTLDDLAEFLGTINSEFSGPFDTLSFGGPGPGKPGGGTVVTGVKAVVLSDIFVGSGAEFAPVPPADYSELYEVPATFGLAQNYPNPFNPTTTIEFTIPEDGTVSLKVYNLLGQLVATLADREEFTSGENWVELDASKLASGVYMYAISVNDGEFREVKKMVLMK